VRVTAQGAGAAHLPGGWLPGGQSGFVAVTVKLSKSTTVCCPPKDGPRRSGVRNPICPVNDLMVTTWDASTPSSVATVGTVGFDVVVP
jgi:hypothetical protein